MNLFTIGFTKKTAKEFFELLEKHKVECIIDIRLHPDGQLAGFTKKEDLRFFLKRLIGCDYRYMAQLAPSDSILKKYRTNQNWSEYEKSFVSLMKERGIPYILDRTLFEEKNCCLLCSEPTPEKCHRRLVAELIKDSWGDITIVHI